MRKKCKAVIGRYAAGWGPEVNKEHAVKCNGKGNPCVNHRKAGT